MWINNAEYFLLLLAILIVGWMSIFYIKMNVVKKDDSEVSLLKSPVTKNNITYISSVKKASRRTDDNAITKKRRL